MMHNKNLTKNIFQKGFNIRKSFSLQKGFTLVELLIYMGLSMILLAIISGIFISVLSVRNESIKSSSLEREGRYILARLSHDVYSAQDIIEPATLGESSTTLQLLVNSDLFTYSINDDKLYLTNTSGTHLLSGESVNVMSFNVTRLGNEGGKNAVEIELTTQSQNVSEGKIENRNYQFILALR
ncbi:MAG: prepilin-type N-terminal cleavage/methylation domain-containing protein [Pseudomonadales bacterium]|nr:prepilin-type N-terminal cleavage/methylation domain-containing protein [Pseudomonadales bacterium]